MPDRTFTLQEAQALIPVLESLLSRAMAGKNTIVTFEAELEQVRQRIFVTAGTMVDIIPLGRRKGERDKAVQAAKAVRAATDSGGVHLHDAHTGLLEFPRPGTT